MNIRKRQRFAAALIAAALTLTLAGCGDDREYVEPKDSGSSRSEKTSDTESSKPSDISGDPSDAGKPDPEPEQLKALDMFDFLPEIPVTDASKLEYRYDDYYDGIIITDFLTDDTAIRIPDIIDGKPVIGLELNSKLAYNEPNYSGSSYGLDTYDNTPGYKKYNITELILPDTVKNIRVGVVEAGGHVSAMDGTALINVQYMNLPKDFNFCNGFLSSLKKLYIDEGRKDMPQRRQFINIGDNFSDVYIPTTMNAFSREFLTFENNHMPNVYYCGKTYNGYTDELHRLINDVNGNGLVIKENYYNMDDITVTAFYSDRDEVVIPDGVTAIGADVFRGSKIKSVTIPATVKKLGGYDPNFGAGSFNSCDDLTSVYFEKGSQLETILESFKNCPNLKNITIPDGVTQIWTSFSECTNITDITLGDNVPKEIDWEDVFSACKDNPNLVIHYKDTDCTSFKMLKDVMDGVDVDAIQKGFYINYGILTKYSGSDSNVIIPNSVTWIDREAFYNCTNITSVTLPKSVTGIGSYAFSGCTNLKEVTIPNGVEHIYDHAFSDCTSLTSINIPNSVNIIGASAFYKCNSLTEVRLPDNIELEQLLVGFNFNDETKANEPILNFTTFSGCSKIQVYYKGKTYDYAHIDNLYKLFDQN